MQRLEQTLLTYREELLWIRNVIGCGLAYKETGGVKTDQMCVSVFVESKLPSHTLSVKDRVPPALDGIPTDVVEIGVLRSLHLRRQRVRPAPPGVSIAHYKVSAGTFGAVVYDHSTNAPLILSNNHVLANETTGRDGRSQVGDPIYQPGAYDGGTANDVIARLTRFMPLRFLPQRANLVDAAVAQPIKPDMVKPEILGIGLVTGMERVKIGDLVAKSGRSTGVTSGAVQAINATVTVLYSEGRSARFDNQIVCSKMGDAGDSGALGVTGNNQAFGLLFAGSTVATIFNRIDTVVDSLGVKIVRG